MQNCTDKFLKHSERVGARFAEHNAGESFLFTIRPAYDSIACVGTVSEQMQGR